MVRVNKSEGGFKGRLHSRECHAMSRVESAEGLRGEAWAGGVGHPERHAAVRRRPTTASQMSEGVGRRADGGTAKEPWDVGNREPGRLIADGPDHA